MLFIISACCYDYMYVGYYTGIMYTSPPGQYMHGVLHVHVYRCHCSVLFGYGFL